MEVPSLTLEVPSLTLKVPSMQNDIPYLRSCTTFSIYKGERIQTNRTPSRTSSSTDLRYVLVIIRHFHRSRLVSHSVALGLATNFAQRSVAVIELLFLHGSLTTTTGFSGARTVKLRGFCSFSSSDRSAKGCAYRSGVVSEVRQWKLNKHTFSHRKELEVRSLVYPTDSEMRRITVSTVLVLTLSVLAVVSVVYAETFNVGGDMNWTVDAAFNYTDWAMTTSAKVGDTLVFKYDATQHDVKKVTSEQYDACDEQNSLDGWRTGDDRIILDSAGTWYFLCSEPQHCSYGQKFSIEVSSTSTGSPSSPNSPPPPTLPNAASSLMPSLAGVLALSIVPVFSFICGF